MFNKLKVKEIKKETNDTVSIAFEIPNALKSDFSYLPGQYVTIKSIIDGEDVRRAYSLCSAPFEDDFRIGVKRVDGGKMSTFLNEKIELGSELEVMKPTGNFLIDNSADSNVAFAAGSGITPVLSMIKSSLKVGGSFTLFYGNKTADETIFKTELDGLKSSYPSQFNLHYIYSRENLDNALYEGRIKKEKVLDLLKIDSSLLKSEGFYMCGPEEMIFNVSDALKDLGVSESKIHFELFTAPTTKDVDGSPVVSDFSGESQVTVIMDGDEFEFPLSSDGDFILDVAIENGADAPFSCKGAVCCTCKAQVVEGKATMDMNYSLSDEEVEEGFILTCQARPASEKLVVDYDVT
jgi:ring-1,2-phenylacetyl-CoA epoxidase subunit PaaE